MNEATVTVQNLIDILTEEIELAESFEMTERGIMNAVLNSTWDTLEISLSRAEGLSLRIESIDRERAECIEILRKITGADKNEHFYRLTAGLEPAQQKQVNDLYRKLKIAVLNLRNTNWRINAYVATVTGIMKQTLQEIYPNRRGSLYSRAGRIREAGNNPMVLNKEL